jgi:cytochrome c
MERVHVKSILIAAMAAAAWGMSSGAMASEAVAKSAGCNKCHAMDSEKDGPSYKALAKKFKGKDEAAVVAAIKGNSEHSKLKAKDDDLKTIAGWLLKM